LLSGSWVAHDARNCRKRQSDVVFEGSVSLRLYPHNDLPASDVVAELRAQAALAAEHGFDGVMVSEHHGGFAGYLPNPIQTAGFLLDAVPAPTWAAPCPLLLPLRPAPLVVEEIAWLAARFPGRVGVGLAAGALKDDFVRLGVPHDDLTRRFADGLRVVADALSGREGGSIDGDPAVVRCRHHPVPVLSAAMGFTAVRRAAAHDVGLLFDSLSTPARIRELTDAYRAAGGRRACVLVRRAWVGAPPNDLFDAQVDVSRSYSPAEAQARWKGDQVLGAADAIADAARDAGCDAVNLRIHVPGVSPSAARDQIAALGETVVTALRSRLG
jgi:alkanesulfonate monooxygenase SsuD/methylene tetrahydromethanopterin reductase-like flavin-dependent oxidoreductase (luciferase family)